jgi:hypothetical protein
MYPWQPSEYRSNRKTSEPFTNRQFFLCTLVLSAMSFIPVIGWISAFFLVLCVITWMCIEPKGFFSVVWRTFLSFVLLCSTWVLVVYLTGPGTYDYTTQFVTVGAIGFALSAFGLVRSIIVARRQDI